jgi:hypothetical protein
VQMRGITSSVIAAASVASAACRPSEPTKVPERYRAVFEAPVPGGDSAFARLSPAEQVDAFVFGITYFKPGRVGLADDVADTGQDVIPFVLARLKTENSNFVRWQLLSVIAIIRCTPGVRLRNEQQVVGVTRDVTKSIKGPYQAEAEAVAREIYGQCREHSSLPVHP